MDIKLVNHRTLIGYAAGITTGITYGFNPLFGVPLMNNGASIESILFFRYLFAVLFLGAYMLLRGQSFKISWKQAGILLFLGVLYMFSSIFLFEAYNYIASGLATTLIFLYPVIVALIMVFLKVYPSWQVWLSIFITFAGVVIMTQGDSAHAINPIGVLLSLGSASVYALFIVIINRSKAIGAISNSLLTFYALMVGATIFFLRVFYSGAELTTGIEGCAGWFNIFGLALLPTVVSTATLAISTRNIGATKASVLGVFEPITAILIGTLVFGEVLSTNIVIGIILSVAAVVFMIVSTKK